MVKHEFKYFCDRCEKEFFPEEGTSTSLIKMPYSSYRIDKVSSNSYLDLCDKCKEEFVHWLERKEE